MLTLLLCYAVRKRSQKIRNVGIFWVLTEKYGVWYNLHIVGKIYILYIFAKCVRLNLWQTPVVCKKPE